MPHADPEKQRQAQAEYYRRRYKDPKFRKQEAERKADWQKTAEGIESTRASSLRRYYKLKAVERIEEAKREAAAKARHPARRLVASRTR